MWGILSAALFFLPFNRLIAWLMLAASAAIGLYHHILTPISLVYLAVMILIAWLRHHYREQRLLAPLLEFCVVLCVVALFCHQVPGFYKQLMVDQAQVGPLSSTYSLNYHFDKALIPFLLYACLPTLFNTANTHKRMRIHTWLILMLCIPLLLVLAVMLSALKVELHMPHWILMFVMANLFFVSMAEEAFFRGYIQQRISQWLGAYPALMVASLLFGAAHLAGGILMGAFATLAGVIYGLAWMWSGCLWVPIIFHLSFNLTHLLFFTYPLYLHSYIHQLSNIDVLG